MNDEISFDNEEIVEEDVGAKEGSDDLAQLLPLAISQTAMSATDWTVETLIGQIDKGNILLTPKYQRREAWRSPKQSKFIESLILGFPVPQLVLAASNREKGSYIVIDGKQRLLSIRNFVASPDDSEFNQLCLKELEIRKDLNGKTLEDIKNNPDFIDDVRAFENQTIRTIVIKGWKTEGFLYHVFLRLNTETVVLSPQELRQALHPGAFIDFAVAESLKSKALKRILKLKEPDFRMRDVELLIRYFAFKNFLHKYNGILKEFLDSSCNELNNLWETREEELKQQLEAFEEATEATYKIFDDRYAFRKWKNSKYETRFNRALFDIMVYYFSLQEVRDKALDNKKIVEEKFRELSSNRDFLGSVESTTKSLEATHFRFNAWAEALNSVLGTHLPIPILKEGRIAFSREGQ